MLFAILYLFNIKDRIAALSIKLQSVKDRFCVAVGAVKDMRETQLVCLLPESECKGTAFSRTDQIFLKKSLKEFAFW